MSLWKSFWDIFWWSFCAFVFLAYLFAFYAVIGDIFRDHHLNGWWKGSKVIR